jgi:hypothetical protein
MGNFDVIGDIATFWPFAPLLALVVAAWFAVRWWRRKPPTI